jgi:hypothetical protein
MLFSLRMRCKVDTKEVNLRTGQDAKIASEDRMAKFNIEMQKNPFRRMKERFRFMSYDELSALYETAIPFYELKTRLLKEN